MIRPRCRTRSSPSRCATSSRQPATRVTDRPTVEVVRGGIVVGTASGLVPQDDPKTAGFDGLVEVNHPGGGCWEGVTPDIRGH